MKIGLVLEGGGMRGVYTAGVLDSLINKNYCADYLIGVSAGCTNGASYVSWQKERGMRTNINYIDDKRYLSFWSYLKTGSLFGMDFLFYDIPEKLDPFDYESCFNSKCDYRVGITNIETGEEEYYGKEALKKEDRNIILRASTSLPIVSPIVTIKGKKYLDGGIGDPIPIKRAFEEGCDKVIVVLTRDRNYKKKATKGRWFFDILYRKYPKLVELIFNRHERYNSILEYIREMEKEGKAFVVAPEKPIEIDKFEKSKEKLFEVYKLGLADGTKVFEKYKEFLDVEGHQKI